MKTLERIKLLITECKLLTITFNINCSVKNNQTTSKELGTYLMHCSALNYKCGNAPTQLVILTTIVQNQRDGLSTSCGKNV